MSATTSSSSTSPALREVALAGCKDELTDYTVYMKLAEPSYQKNPKFREVLSNLARTEYGHFEFWSRYCPEKAKEIKVSKFLIYYVLLIRYILGVSFAIKYLEKHERSVINRYKSVAHLIPQEDKAQFEIIIRDEEEHENDFAEQIQSGYVKYISFIVLGLADALVEIAGIHAGSLGIYDSTKLTGLAGIVAGAAASIAMSSAAYAQAKQGFQGSASLSAFYTGISYFVSALILAMPYFLTEDMINAISLSLVLAILIVAFISYYNSVLSNESFKRSFAELTGVILGATAALYVIGLVIRSIFGITI